MRVVIAIDSFKGSLTSMEAGYAAREGILGAVPQAEVIVKPLADGGEGTTEALIEGLGGKYVTMEVTGPLGNKVTAGYGILNDNTAVMEMAEAAGIVLVDRNDLNPHIAATYGVGEMILDAVKLGCRKFIIGIGGSATTDGGVGMLQALGFEFSDINGDPIPFGIDPLDRIEKISSDDVIPELDECHFQIACDVRNPLCGENGAVYMFGSQKGVKENEKEVLDKKMSHYADKTAEFIGIDNSNAEGAGAAGGLGFAFLSYMKNAELRPGTDIVLEAVGLEDDIKDSDIVITGEGRLDTQTAMGKAPMGVARLGKKYGRKVIAFAGSVSDDAAKCNDEGIDAFFPILREVTTLEEAMDKETAKKNLALAAEQVFRLL